MEAICTLQNITKYFYGVQALDGVSLELYEGEVHALVGENGAGKSTLMKIFSGVYQMDSGSIIIDGKTVSITNVASALACGVSMVYQELNVLPDLTVAENIFMGHEPKTKHIKMVSKKKMVQKTLELFEKLEIDSIDPNCSMRELSVAESQLIEIAKVVLLNCRFLIMDEPTSALTNREVDKLIKVIEKLKKNGVSIVYISHKMDEIFRISDRATVMRDGKLVGSLPISDLDIHTMVRMMVGRELKDMYPHGEKRIQYDQVLLEIRDFSNAKDFNKISFQLHAGEILGIAGLMGAGRTELVESIFGLRRKERGTVILSGKEVNIKKPVDAIKNRIALITEDRKVSGLILCASVLENMSVVALKRFTKFGFLQKRTEGDHIDEQISQLNIKTPSKTQIVANLSGGNQQKVVLAKWLLTNAEVIIFDEPTRGIDVGAKVEIYKIMYELAQMGKGVIMISSEMPELLGMSDRILALHEGTMTGELKREEFDEITLMAMLVNVQNEEEG